MSYVTCKNCDVYNTAHKSGKCVPSSRDWFQRGKYEEPLEFIPVDKMCRHQSPFGNEFIGLTQEDINRLKNGEVIHISGEYGTFIGFIEKESE